jgi:single-stranded-DNA-specific exonuclease
MFSTILRGIYDMKRWIVKGKLNGDIRVHNNSLINTLFISRGIIEKSEARRFVQADLSELHDPYLLRDMDKAIDKIDDVIRRRDKIVIYGDYDVDGITSTSILYRALKKLGAHVSYYIPDRINEGYGINKNAVDYINSLASKLIITVDCGISAVEEVEYVKSLGMEIIITDHHECKNSIPNTIVINPKRPDCSYPFKSLAGCGVAFKLVQALWKRYNLSGFDDFLDIAAIGTIADIVELKGENRIIAKNGIVKISASEKCGIKAMKLIAGIDKDITSSNIAFQIAPRINAIGRLRDAKIAVELFTTNDYDKALQIAKYLDQENKKRQKIEETILSEALIKIQEEINLKHNKVIVLSSPNWHIGVVGIVASRIVEKFNRPAILFCEEGERSRGSGRSIEGFNLFNSLCECEEILLKFGGHELAAGLTVSTNKINELRQRLEVLADKVAPDYFMGKIDIDLKVDPEDIGLETAELLKNFEPFGCGNPSPTFYMEQLAVLSKRGVGNRDQHLKLSLEKDGHKLDGISFNGSKEFLDREWDIVDVAFNIDINDWNNKRSVQLIIKDIKPYTDWLKSSLHNNYYVYLKNALNNVDGTSDLSKVRFVKKNVEFLKEFLYFNRGYVLVSSYDSLTELEFLFDYFKVNGNVNVGLESQIILCPSIDSIEFGDNDVLIYDFLPGEYEYDLLDSRTNSTILNFIDSGVINKVNKFLQDIDIEEKLIFKFIDDLRYNKIVGKVSEITALYDINSYKAYRMIIGLKETGIINVIIDNDVLNITTNDKANLSTLYLALQSEYINKILKVKTKFNTFLGRNSNGS